MTFFNKRTKNILVSFLVAFGFMTLLVGFVASQVQYNFYWSNNVRFGLTTYDTTIDFTGSFYLGNFSFNDGDSITFNNLYLTPTDNNVDEVTFLTQTSNMTIGAITEEYLYYLLDGAGTQNITLAGVQPTWMELDEVKKNEGDGWSQTGNTITVTGATYLVEMQLEEIEYEFIGTNTTGFTDPLFQYIIEGDFLYFVSACYTSVLGSAFWGIVVFFFSAIVYLKTKSLFLVGLIYMLVGPTYIILFQDFSFLAVLFTIVGIAGLLAEFILVWRNRT